MVNSISLITSSRIKYNFTTIIIAFIYASSLSFLIPMEQISDRENYLTYATSSEVIAFGHLAKGFVSFISNEPLWLAINVGLNAFIKPEQIVLSVIFFSAFITSFLILKSNPKYFFFLLFMLLFPQVITKHVVHLRQGLAISIFLLGWFSSSKSWRLLILGLTPFIHASFFFVLTLMFLTFVFRRLRFAVDLKTIFVVLLGLVVSFSLGHISSFLGARQSEQYEFSQASVSGLGFVFWLSVFVLYWLQGRSFTQHNAFIMVCIAFYLTTYFLIEVTGRIFESTVIITFLAGLGLTSWRRKVFMACITHFVLLSWLVKFNEPWLGWGGG
jgi:hypothetical protein